jgi:hypothetical protein
MKKYDEIKSIGSMSVTISREQVMEVVVESKTGQMELAA